MPRRAGSKAQQSPALTPSERRLAAAAVIRAPITTGRNQSQAARQALADTRAPQIADM